MTGARQGHTSPHRGREGGDGPPSSQTRPPTLRIVRGDATPEEIAALVTTLTAVARSRADAARRARAAAERPRSQWADRSRMLRRPLPRGGGWRVRPGR